MFLLGLLIGAASAGWFILEDNGDRLIRLGERIRNVARLFQEWRDHSRRYGA
jgi:CRISPR/Cas system Type II protein with McrA/HNH and RuvC-like nuclease domain